MKKKDLCRFVCCLLVPGVAHVAHAGTLNPPPKPTIGSTNVATADLLVSRPSTQPCTVTLFSLLEFADFSEKPFSYAPPANCPGPWAKVVFEGDFSVTPGVQYDRTGYLNLGSVNIFFGTTAEPSSTNGPSWHIERDLTDYSALFTSPQSGAASLGNLVNSTYTGVIYGTATLQFYPASSSHAAPQVADAVLPLSTDSVTLANTGSQLTQTLNSLPHNIERAYIDVIAQSQSSDEFWYACVPDDVASQLESCGGTAFREVEVSLDGQPAGVAPVYPWIFTGGLDPYLWSPVPGVQTLNFTPYRVDLTPFAGVLSDGQPHTVALSVFNADNYFVAEANLLLYLDHCASQVTGAVTQNTLTAAPSPTVNENLHTTKIGTTIGSVSIASARDFTISGYVDTSHGRVTTTLKQSIAFANRQRFDVGSERYVQNIVQSTHASAITRTATNDGVTTTRANLQYPLSIGINVGFSSTQGTQAVTVDQSWLSSQETRTPDGQVSRVKISNEVTPTDTLLFDPNTGVITGHQDQSGQQHYRYTDSDGDCYDRSIQSAAGAVTAVQDLCN